jgi:phosphoribosylanthranilate isomerase
MSHIIIQIYEIQTPSEAEALIELGVDHIGSVVISENEWKIPLLKETMNLVGASTSMSSLIPLFNKADSVFQTLDHYQPDIVHFCEALTDSNGILPVWQKLLKLQADIKERFPEIKVMRSVPITRPGLPDLVPTIELARMFEPASDYFLTDTMLVNRSTLSSNRQPVESFIGLTGQTCDWDMAAQLVESSNIPVILAGGLSPENVFDGIMRVRPAGVDSCTATNARDADGFPLRFKKDLDRVKRFVEDVRRAEKGGKI